MRCEVMEWEGVAWYVHWSSGMGLCVRCSGDGVCEVRGGFQCDVRG